VIIVGKAVRVTTDLFNFRLERTITQVSPQNLSSFERLFKSLFAPLCGYAMKYVSDQDDAKNIVHEVFIAVWEKFESLPEGTNHKSYLYTAVKNKSLNFIRDRKKHIHLEEMNEDEPMEENLVIEAQELEREIEMGIESLPEKCREVFQLNRQEGLKYAEIAAKLGISIKTVEAQMSKALAILREQLKEFLVLLIFILFE
jgi:RNA polymerase sigma-70 factor, ECF subfamily